MKYWEEYQSKFGFGDGEAIPPDAWACRAAYIRWINRRAEKLESKVRLLAWDRNGCHNCYLILSIAAKLVAGVPERKLWIGQWAHGFDPGEGWEETPADAAMDQAVQEAQDAELDSDVTTEVKLRSRRKEL